MIEGELELIAMVARFRAIAADWLLTPTDVATLLQVDRDDLGLDLVPRDVSGCEHRMRLLLEVASIIDTATGGRAPRVWLHSSDLPHDPERVTPLEFLSGPLPHLRALRMALLHHA
jgi:hypothetical protein